MGPPHRPPCKKFTPMHVNWFSPRTHVCLLELFLLRLNYLAGTNTKSNFCVRNGVREEGQSREGKRCVGLWFSKVLKTAEACRWVWDFKSSAAIQKGIWDSDQSPSKSSHQNELQMYFLLLPRTYELKHAYTQMTACPHTHMLTRRHIKKKYKSFLPNHFIICKVISQWF